MIINYNKLSKILSHALRHEPEVYGLTLLNDGWIQIDTVVTSINKSGDGLEWVTKNDIYRMIEISKKKRHEIIEDMIRSVYGHSLDVLLNYQKITPPKKLYHGTIKESAHLILSEGLKPISRVFVHLSSDKDTAYTVAKRKTSDPVLLNILAKEAENDEVSFYFANEKTWLTKFVPAKFISLITENETQ